MNAAKTWRLRAASLGLWPEKRPATPSRMHGWLHGGNERVLRSLIADRAPRVIIEIGSWLGLCTTLLMQETEALGTAVFAVDPWDAAFIRSDDALRSQYTRDPTAVAILDSVPLYTTFLKNLWPHRRRCFPLRMPSHEGLAAIARLGAPVDMIYVDGDHSYEAVLADLREARAHFPDALVCGDDWLWPEVRRAVRKHAASVGGLEVRAHPRENWWVLDRTALPYEAETRAGAASGEQACKRQRCVEFVSAADADTDAERRR